MLHMSTSHLRRLHATLANPIPGDATFASAVAQLLRAMIDVELVDPKRIEADKKMAEETAKHQKEEREATRKAELEAVKGDEEATRRVKARHAAESARLEQEAKRKELADKQAAERAAFEEQQRTERAKGLPAEEFSKRPAFGKEPSPEEQSEWA